MLRARLKVIGGKHRGKTIPLMGAKFLIGREQDCQLRPTSELISRHHCAITVDEFTVRLRDLGSTNGTYVNEQRVHGQVKLKSSDVIRVGKLRFEMLITELSDEEARKLSSSGSATALADILATTDTTELSGSDTAHDVRLPLIVPEDSALNHSLAGDSGTFELGATPAGLIVGSDAASEPETSVVSHQTLVPTEPTYPMQQPMAGYQQPSPYAPLGAYPQMPPQYPQMPMAYPPMPYGYPQPGMYPQPMYPPMPQMPAMYPQQQMGGFSEPLPEDKPSKKAVDEFPAVTLPDPAKTGVKAAAPPPAPAAEAAPKPEGAAAADAAKKKNPSQEAADIIRQHMSRRPGT